MNPGAVFSTRPRLFSWTSLPLFSFHFHFEKVFLFLSPSLATTLFPFLCPPTPPRPQCEYRSNSSPRRFLPFSTNFPSEITSRGALISGGLTRSANPATPVYAARTSTHKVAHQLFLLPLGDTRSRIPPPRCRQSKQQAWVMATSGDKVPRKPEEPCAFLSSATFQTSRLGLISPSPNQLLLARVSPLFSLPLPDSSEQVRAGLSLAYFCSTFKRGGEACRALWIFQISALMTPEGVSALSPAATSSTDAINTCDLRPRPHGRGF